jgi:Fe-S-cluster-containing dehydrogenase component/anaerobic selenocysteine-containing dehydrogenase
MPQIDNSMDTSLNELDQIMRADSRVPQDILSAWNRRDFLKLMGASMALASLSCTRNRLPIESVLPYAKSPEDLVLGESQYFATTFPMPGFVQGILVESHEGRPTKIEGNPRHPASRGATHLLAQASILDLYSPFRLKTVVNRSGNGASLESKWDDFAKELSAKLKIGDSIALLTGTVISPTLRQQIEDLTRANPKIQWFSFDPVNLDNVYQGLKNETGSALESVFDFAKATRVLSIDHDFMLTEPGSIAHVGDYFSARRKRSNAHRLYVIEPSLSVTGTKADHRWAFSTKKISRVLSFIEEKLTASAPSHPVGSGGFENEFGALIKDLLAHKGESLICAGRGQSPEIHAQVYRLNKILGNIGRTVSYRAPLHESHAFQTASLENLCNKMREGAVSTLLMLGNNPAYTAPKDFEFQEAIKKVGTKIHLTQAENETSALCDWVLPESHYLETWGDAESNDGSISLIQPLIRPLYDSKSSLEVLDLLLISGANAYEAVRKTWSRRLGSANFEITWRKFLRDGSGSNPVKERVKISQVLGQTRQSAQRPPPASETSEELELLFRPDPTVWDGSGSENPWLQELPKPPTQIAWDNAVLMSPATAKKNQNLKNNEIVRLHTSEGVIEAPIFIVSGLPDQTMTLHLGYGRKISGPVAKDTGFNAYPIRSKKNFWSVPVSKIEKTGGKYEIACSQEHHEFGERDLLRTVRADRPLSVKPTPMPIEEDIGRGAGIDKTYQWAMSIDLESCIGCSACVVACQAENNIPVVGKQMMINGRAMHWIRIDRYIPELKDASTDSTARPQPVTCMHCEKAPCEVVCPVGATSHSQDGLNQMVYNRCVGTRYCSNNCPYKVRRFNFYSFSESFAGGHESYQMQRNPNVTVRSRGVMEKCTYCVQRIQAARIKTEKENRTIKDGDIRTACQQSCPSQAIVFGNLLDPESAIHKARETSRTYGLLTELGTRPRTTYLSDIVNPNTAVEIAESGAE